MTKEIEALKSSQLKGCLNDTYLILNHSKNIFSYEVYLWISSKQVKNSGQTGLTSTNSDLASLKQKNSDLENEIIALKTNFLQIEEKVKNNEGKNYLVIWLS